MAINKLTDVAFRKIKPTDTEQLLADGGGLYVRVRSQSEEREQGYRPRVEESQ
ncbi:Arm DNA-binding domain-containing protein [Candidatus Methylospira mobilis]|uniref:Arm DNA-binding domain-containing protein n=1 Tax=Candidatus Methylospira mobilis TaxID=1808979 RepID=UPI001884BC9A|nr:Arm DNA-binding domain-containing protein [Candidatus Methylospira mobilis]